MMFDLFLTILHVVILSGMILFSIVILKRSRKLDEREENDEYNG